MKEIKVRKRKRWKGKSEIVIIANLKPTDYEITMKVIRSWHQLISFCTVVEIVLIFLKYEYFWR